VLRAHPYFLKICDLSLFNKPSYYLLRNPI